MPTLNELFEKTWIISSTEYRVLLARLDKYKGPNGNENILLNLISLKEGQSKIIAIPQTSLETLSECLNEVIQGLKAQ